MKELDDDVVTNIQKQWSKFNDVLDKASGDIEEELVKCGADEDTAFSLIDVIMLHRIFLKRTIIEVANHGPDVMDWIKEEFYDWDDTWSK